MALAGESTFPTKLRDNLESRTNRHESPQSPTQAVRGPSGSSVAVSQGGEVEGNHHPAQRLSNPGKSSSFNGALVACQRNQSKESTQHLAVHTLSSVLPGTVSDAADDAPAAPSLEWNGKVRRAWEAEDAACALPTMDRQNSEDGGRLCEALPLQRPSEDEASASDTGSLGSLEWPSEASSEEGASVKATWLAAVPRLPGFYADQGHRQTFVAPRAASCAAGPQSRGTRQAWGRQWQPAAVRRAVERCRSRLPGRRQSDRVSPVELP